jgi:hypothetical protein
MPELFSICGLDIASYCFGLYLLIKLKAVEKTGMSGVLVITLVAVGSVLLRGTCMVLLFHTSEHIIV